ncbi:uncharacterized protein ACR2FA_012614 [Aphomia sociella]
MRPLVVLFAVIAASLAAPQYLVQQAYSPAVVLDPVGPALHYQARALHGHILKKRSVVPVAYSVPSAVSHQSRVDVHTSPAVVATAPVVAEPAVIEARAIYAAPAAVSHQSRVDVRTSPAVVTPVVAPVVESRAVLAEPVVARSYVPAATVYAGGSAVTHQSRVDVETSPAVVTQEVIGPAIVDARSVYAPSVYSTCDHSIVRRITTQTTKMKSMVVLFALATAAYGSLISLAQPPHHPAIVLDPHGRPLDTAEVINARALHLQAKALDNHHIPLVHAAPIAHGIVAPAVVAAPAAVSHQARIEVSSSPALVSHAYAPLLSHAIAGHGHLLKKRSLAHITPVIAPSAVSHQSRLDVISSPATVSHAIAAPLISHAVAAPVAAYSILDAPIHSVHADWSLSHGHLLKKRSLAEILAPTVLSHSIAAPLVSHAVAAPVIAVAPSAISHQSRVDIHSSPAVVAHSVVAPVHSIWNDFSLSHGHLLKKRSLASLWAPSVVSHALAAPVVVAAPSAVSHQSRVDVINSAAHIVPLAHSAVWTAPVAHLSHSGLVNVGHW